MRSLRRRSATASVQPPPASTNAGDARTTLLQRLASGRDYRHVVNKSGTVSAAWRAKRRAEISCCVTRRYELAATLSWCCDIHTLESVDGVNGSSIRHYTIRGSRAVVLVTLARRHMMNDVKLVADDTCLR